MEILNTFSQFVTKLSKDMNCFQFLEHYETHYNLRKFKITEISANTALQMFQHIVQKFYKNHNPGQSGTWVQNQLRLYIWSVICYIEINRKQLKNFTKQDWDFFASIFLVKEYNLFEYQARILLDETVKTLKWTQQEDCTLFWIINKDKKAKWNQIAKNMFIKSNKKFLRASKQCRQRWFNHLDPSKVKSQWSLKQYLIVFQQVELKGKKWALIVKALKEKRSQHSIKNKYNSILKKQLRLTPNKTQLQACRQLIAKINSIFAGFTPESNDEYLFGCSLKLLRSQQVMKDNQDQINNKQTKTSLGDPEISKNRFEIFRKKIENFQSNHQQGRKNYKNQTQSKNKNSKKQSMNKFITFNTLNSINSFQQKEEKIQREEIQEDQIYYDDSLSGNQLLMQEQFNIFSNEQLRGLIQQSDLDM